MHLNCPPDKLDYCSSENRQSKLNSYKHDPTSEPIHYVLILYMDTQLFMQKKTGEFPYIDSSAVMLF